MKLVGQFASWPVEVADVDTGVMYQTHHDGAVYRCEPPRPPVSIGRTQLVGRLEQIPTDLAGLWAACERVYWEEVTEVVIPVDADLTPVQPTSVVELLRDSARGY